MGLGRRLICGKRSAKSIFYAILFPSTLLSLLYCYVAYDDLFIAAKNMVIPVHSVQSNLLIFGGSEKLSELTDSIHLHPFRRYPGSTKFSLQHVLPLRQQIHFDRRKCTGLKKWLVTVYASTGNISNVEHLLKYLGHEWCLLILRDQMNGMDWSNNKQLIYLNKQKQLSLPFEIVKQWSNSTNTLLHTKNIGFLFAIYRGAQIILDLDSNYLPIKLNGQYFPVFRNAVELTMPVQSLNSTDILWNPYQHFGVRNTWPRNENRFHTLPRREIVTKIKCLPIVQQYLVNNGPDTDKVTKSHISHDFENMKSIAVPYDMYTQYNSLTTVHLYDAFWSLLLPLKADQRMSDMWRSYISQHLFHLLPGTCVVFTPPAVQCLPEYKPVSLNDSNSTMLLPPSYTPSQVVEVLDQSSQFKAFDQQSLFKVYVQLYEFGLLQARDVEYSRSWLTDLKQIGYHFPTQKWQSRLWTTNVQLCIMFNLKSMRPQRATVSLLLRYYMQFFKHILILFDGLWPNKPDFIPYNVAFSGCASDNGWYQHICLNTCLQQTRKSKISGYLYISDDMFINLTTMSSYSRSELWYIRPSTYNYTYLITEHPKDWHWGPPRYFENVLNSVMEKLPGEWENNLKQYGWSHDRLPVRGIFDIIYVPVSLAPELKRVLTFIIETGDLFCEIAGPLAVEIVVPQSKRVVLRYGYLWKDKRSIANIIKTASTASFVHPIKIGKPAERRLWKQLMEKEMFSLRVIQ